MRPSLRVLLFAVLTLFLVTLVSTDAGAQRRRNMPKKGAKKEAVQAPQTLEVMDVQAVESGDSFSMQVNMRVVNNDPNAPEDHGGEDEGYGAPPTPGLEFNALDVYPFVSIKPAVKFSVSPGRKGFSLIGNFKPETDYVITIDSGLRTRAGDTLAKKASHDVRVGSFRPRFSFKSKARYMPPQFASAIPFESVNVGAVDFSIRQIYPQNLHQWLTSGEYASNWVSDSVKTSRQMIKNEANKHASGKLSLADLNATGQGVFVVSAHAVKDDQPAGRRGGRRSRRGGRADPQNLGETLDTMTVVVTNISAVVKKTDNDQVRVWTFSTQDLAPMNDVQVEVHGESNRRMGTCRTSGGECTVKVNAGLSAPYALTLKHGNDQTYIRFSDLALKNDRFQAGERSFGLEMPFDAFVFPERDLYRPGETVHLAAIVRNKKLETAAKFPVQWRITNPRGKIVREIATETSANGSVALDYPTHVSVETGKYTAELVSGKQTLHSSSFLVEEFVPERVGIQVAAAKEHVIGQNAADFQVQANYLFGPPVAKGRYSVSCSLKPAFKTIPKNADYFTGVYSKEAPKAITLEPQVGELNDNGAARASCQYGTKLGAKAQAVYELRAKTDVAEAGSARVTSKSATTLVGTTDTILGVKLQNASGRTIKLAGALFDLKGDRAKKATTVSLKLFSIRNYWYYSYGGYGENWKVEEIISPTAVEKTVQVADGAFEASIDVPSDWGQWLVRAVDTQSTYVADLNVGYIGYYYPGEGAPGKNGPPDPDEVKIQLSKTELQGGEKFKALIVSPFAGKLLVGLEGEKIHEARWINVAKPGPVEVELTAPAALPNFYVTALVLKQPKEGGGGRFLPARAWGAKSATVIPDKHRMTVKVAHPELTESRKEISIALSNDKNEQAEYTVAVVDEGILQMTSFATPNPLQRFFDPRRLDITSLETLGWTYAQPATKESAGGDGAGKSGNAPTPVRLVSFWFPRVESDAKGNAKVTVPLPAFQGKVRVMAVASGKTRMGSASGFTTVRDPIVIQSTLPRFMTQGDQVHFPVALTNTSGKDQTVNLAIETKGPVDILTPKQTVQLPNGQMKVVNFTAITKTGVGLAQVNVKAVSADGKLNSLEEFNVPVRPSGVEQTLRLAVETKTPEIALASHVPSEWKRDYMKVEAMVSDLPYLTELSHLGTLINYPYGCLEQTTSSTMPLLTIQNLLRWADPVKTDGSKQADIKDMVHKGIDRVVSMQTSSGGFGYWPGAESPAFWATAYATHMLIDAKKLGYTVPQTALNNALSYLTSNVRRYSSQRPQSPYSERSAVPLALYVLAKAGKSVGQELRTAVRTAGYQPVTTANAQIRPGIDAENTFLLGAAAKILGDQQTLDQLLSDTRYYGAQLVGGREDYYTYWSALRSDGLRLSILEDLWPGHAATSVLAQRLALELGKRNAYYSTQDMAWAVHGLGKLVHGMKKVDPKDLKKVTMELAGKKQTHTSEAAGSLVFAMDTSQVSSAKLKIGSAPAQGAFTYLKLTGYAKSPPSGAGALEVNRIYHTMTGPVANPGQIEQGSTYVVELVINNKSNQTINNAAIVDYLPAGFEIENPRLGRSETMEWITESAFKPDYQDLRDDRVQVFGNLPAGTSYHYYVVRAVTKGTFTAPGSFVEAMYDPGNFDYQPDVTVVIKEPAKK